MKKDINDILLQMQNNSIDVGEAANQLLNLFSVSLPTNKELQEIVVKMGILNKFISKYINANNEGEVCPICNITELVNGNCKTCTDELCKPFKGETDC